MISVKITALVYARALWRRRWYGVAVAWLICLAGWVFVMQLPNVYEAKARIYVDTDSMLRPLMRGIAIDSNILSQVDLMQRTLLSTPNLQKVSHAADLDLAARTPSESEDIVTGLRQRIAVSPDGRNLFSLSYTGPNREAATKVVQSLLTVFVESNLGSSRQDMVSARAFIDTQLNNYAQQLDQAEHRVAEFKGKYAGYIPGEDNYSAKRDAAKLQLEKTQAELAETLQKREALAKQLGSIPQTIESYSAGPELGPGRVSASAPGEVYSAAAAELATANARVADLQKKLDTALENYTEQHPDVINTRRLLEQARQEAKAAQARYTASQVPRQRSPQGGALAIDPRATRSTAPNPVYEQLQLQLITVETVIASLEARVKHDQAEVEKWEALAKSVPEVAAEMTKLTRDYDAIKRSYDDFRSRREAAKVGSDMETQTQTIQFRIVDPPLASRDPVAPKRLLLLSVVLLAGLAAGGAFAFLLSQIDDSVMNVRQLKEFLAVPILGAVSMVASASSGRRRGAGMAGFVTCCLGLVLVYAGVCSLAAFTAAHA
jgi:polysaccharide chain length determinant protein (PEP-CTERM system associated)